MRKKRKNLLPIVLVFTLALCSIVTVFDAEAVHAKAPDIKAGLELQFDVSQYTAYVAPDSIRTDKEE